MPSKPEFSLHEFKIWLEEWVAQQKVPSKYCSYEELIKDYSIPFGNDMLAKLKTYSRLDTRWIHEGYGLDFVRDANGHWGVVFNEFVKEFLHMNNTDRRLKLFGSVDD